MVVIDYLVIVGVFNWGGLVLVVVLWILNQCLVYLWYVRCGVGIDGVSVFKEDVLIIVEMVMVLVKLLMFYI